MINLKSIFDKIKNSEILLSKRGIKKKNIEEIEILLRKKNKITFSLNEKRKERNISSKKRQNNEENGKNIKTEIRSLEENISTLEKKIEEKILKIPNIPHETVPEKENIVLKEKKFHRKVNHSMNYSEILEKMKMVDNKRASKMSGSKFTIYKGKGANILNYLKNKMIEINTKDGYELIFPPHIVNKESLYNTGQLPKFKKDLFELKGKKGFLIPTSEVPLVNMYSGETIKSENLPLMVTSYTPCFRLEAGSLGKKDKGIIRMHQFNKVEIVSITDPEKSYEMLEKMINTCTKILDFFKIDYKVILLSCKEMSESSSKTIDINMILPISGEIEVSSASNCEDYQTKRSGIKIDHEGKKIFAHSLNASSLAIDRLLAAIAEYYFDGNDVKVPGM